MIQTAIRRCGICHKYHPDDLTRYRCVNCGEVLCAAMIWKGRDFGRGKDKLHVHQVTRKDTGQQTLRPCGAVERVVPK